MTYIIKQQVVYIDLPWNWHFSTYHCTGTTRNYTNDNFHNYHFHLHYHHHHHHHHHRHFKCGRRHHYPYDYSVWGVSEFRIHGRPRTSACFYAKVMLMRVTSHQEDKQTWGSCGRVAKRKDSLKHWKVLEVSKLIYRLQNLLFQTAKGKSVRLTKKNNEPNMNLTEIVVGEWVQ